MASGNNGAKLSIYFESGLWKGLDFNASKLGISPNDFVRHVVRQFIESNTKQEIKTVQDELGKLQVFNVQMFKYLAHKLGYLEMLSAIASDEHSMLDYDTKLCETRAFNQTVVQEIIEDSI